MTKRVKEPLPEMEPTSLEPPAEPAAETPLAASETPLEPRRETPIAESTPPKTETNLRVRVKRGLLFLLRLILTIAMLTALAVGLAYVMPLLYQKYIQPVNENTSQLADLKTRVAQSEIRMTDLQAQLQTAQTAQAGQAQALATLEAKTKTLEEQLAAHTRSLTALDSAQATLSVQVQAADAELTRQVALMKSMELLSRARLFMYQSNFGLARQDVQTARDLLAEVRTAAPEPLASNLTEVVARLDKTLSNLPDFPVAANADLDIAWQILLAGMPAPQATAVSPSATPAPELPAATSTPLPSLEATTTP